ncbi:MAG: LysM peptidoglycan-binding domain-containing protein [Armatimonadetes bacterium]|nr:LysM peptidoglycan-binding domain-containing protein [Armatimonadota bacterium]
MRVKLASVIGLTCLAALFVSIWVSVSNATVVIEIYRAKSGDTLEKIASQYGVSLADLQRKNGFLPAHKVRPGDTIVVPVSDKSRAKSKGAAETTPPPQASKEALAASQQQKGSKQATGRLLISEIYYVKPGDTLDSIAAKYEVTSESILKKNGLRGDDLLRSGQVLTIPVRESVVYKEEEPKPTPQKEPTLSAKKSVSSSQGKVVGKLGVISASGARIRRSRSTQGRVVYTCSQGTQLLVVDDKDDWFGVMMIDGSTCWVPKKYVRMQDIELLAGKTDAASASLGNGGVINEAYRYLGIPYVYGGSSLSGMDCSAFVRRVFASRGSYLPRTAAAQFSVGAAVGYEQLLSGDRLYFSKNGYRVDHTAIYLGNGQMIHASGRAGYVTVDTLFTPKYWSMFVGARR